MVLSLLNCFHDISMSWRMTTLLGRSELSVVLVVWSRSDTGILKSSKQLSASTTRKPFRGERHICKDNYNTELHSNWSHHKRSHVINVCVLAPSLLPAPPPNPVYCSLHLSIKENMCTLLSIYLSLSSMHISPNAYSVFNVSVHPLKSMIIHTAILLKCYP